jgi:HK97 family phage prohead protease
MNKSIKEIRFSDAQELRIQTDAAGKRTLTGYASVFNEESQDLGGWTEVVKPGCFKRSLASGVDCMALSEHDRNKGLLGRTKSGTLRLNEDNVGLRFECDLPDTQLGNDTATSVARRDLDACSFAFIALDTSWDQNAAGGVVRTLNDVDLQDVTITSRPAYLGTSVQLRSLAEVRAADGNPDPDPVGDDDSCGCDCPQCQAGTCNLCSDPDCEDPNCDDCSEERTNRLLASVIERRLRAA